MIGIILAAMLALSVAFLLRKQVGVAPDSVVKAWEEAYATDNSQANQILMRIGRPALSLPLVYEAGTRPSYRNLQNKVLAAGAYGGSVEVFLAAQAAAMLVSASLLLTVLLFSLTGAVAFAVVALALGIAALPWNAVSKRAAKRISEVATGLPEFAELLMMPLHTGMTILRSISFTANRLEGTVAEEMRNLVLLINSNSMPEAQAFQVIATRLGTPEAAALLATLSQGHMEGAKVTKNIESQAETLRQLAFQKQRAAIKKLPVKLVLIIAVHVIPLLLGSMLLPALVALGDI